MKYRPIGSLIRLNLQTMQPAIWFQFLALLMSMASRFWMEKMWGDYGGSGFRSELSRQVSLILTVAVGGLFLIGQAGTSRTASFIRDEEFLLTRPLSRGRSYFLFIAVYFFLMVGPYLCGLIASLFQSDLKFSLSGNTEAAGKVDLYQAVFSGSHVVPNPQSLIVAHGNTFLCGWWLALVVILALGMQCGALLPFPPKVRQWVPVLFMVPCLGAFYYTGSAQAGLMENAFLCFASHWIWVAGGLSIFFVFAQWLAWARVQRMEVL